MVMNTRKIPRLDEIYIDKSIISERFKDKKASRYDSNYSNCRRKKEARESRVKHTDNQNNNSKEHSDDNPTDDEQLRNKSEIHKLAERVCGDWSEHVSRNGKRYFYNSRTEKSQWDRPKNWIDDVPIAFISKSPERNKNYVTVEKSKQYNAERSNHSGPNNLHKSRPSELTDIRHRSDYADIFKRRTDTPNERSSHNNDYNKKLPDDRERPNYRTDKNHLSEHRLVRGESTNSRDNCHNSKPDYSRYDVNPRSYKTDIKSTDRVNFIAHKSAKNGANNHKNEPGENRLKRSHDRSNDENKIRKRHKISSPSFTDKYKRTSSISQSPSPHRSPSVIRIGSADDADDTDPISSATVQNGCVDICPIVESVEYKRGTDNSVCEDMDISPNISPLQDPKKKKVPTATLR